MTILAMNAPSDILRRPNSLHLWRGDYSSAASSSSSHCHISAHADRPEALKLPSIRNAFPEFDHMKSSSAAPAATGASTTASTPTSTATSTALPTRTTPASQPPLADMSPPSIAVAAAPEYVHSPSSAYKRQRLQAPSSAPSAPSAQAIHSSYHGHPVHRQPAPSDGRDVGPSLSHSRSRSHGYHGFGAGGANDDRPGIDAGEDDRERLSQVVPRHFDYGEVQQQQQQSRHGRLSTSASPPSLYSRHASSASRAGGGGFPSLHPLRFEQPSEAPGRYAHDVYRSGGSSGSSSSSHRLQQPTEYPERPSYRPYNQPPSYGAPQYAHHPSRMQSLSAGSVPSYDRAAFPSSAASGAAYPPPRPFLGHGQPYAAGAMAGAAPGYPHYSPRDYQGGGGYMSAGMMGGMGGGSGAVDGKQRKRRGNLPKETTDKLRNWFVNHLNHPYPSEDEKQDLMRQTGLQMNQISNWFINARRRQLPGMLKNARAESNALTSRSSSNTLGARRDSNGSLSGTDRQSLSPTGVAYQQQQMAMRQFQHHKRQASDYGDDDRGAGVFPSGSPISDDGYDSVPRPRQLTRGSV